MHGSTTQEQTLTLDANGHARGVFAAPELGTNMVFASADVDGAQAVDASEVEVVPLAAQAETDRGSADARVVLDRPVYSVGDDMHVNGTLEGAQGDALVTFESALGAQATVVTAAGGRVAARMGVSNAPGELRVGVASFATARSSGPACRCRSLRPDVRRRFRYRSTQQRSPPAPRRAFHFKASASVRNRRDPH